MYILVSFTVQWDQISATVWRDSIVIDELLKALEFHYVFSGVYYTVYIFMCVYLCVGTY